MYFYDVYGEVFFFLETIHIFQKGNLQGDNRYVTCLNNRKREMFEKQTIGNNITVRIDKQ
ncbi:MAG: hypothetical protein CMD68_02465 [Gammaproteobacteria bacterium]|nr:hypothetical protein [Gammaproteobacteria bacterium]